MSKNEIQSGNVTAEQDKALAMAQKALDKQITKKPIVKETYNLWAVLSTSAAFCPNCKKQIVYVCNIDDYKPKFCHHCGQALDGGEEE